MLGFFGTQADLAACWRLFGIVATPFTRTAASGFSARAWATVVRFVAHNTARCQLTAHSETAFGQIDVRIVVSFCMDDVKEDDTAEAC